MENFGRVRFHGTFRDYQQSVLDNSKKFLKDKKIHIVAAPGSGKTILGLELIRRLNAPALVFSPSVTIRQQWGERFEESYIDSGDKGNYISYDLRSPALITSVTYQALHAAMNRTRGAEEDEEETQDFTGFDLLSVIRDTGIKTVCLDEAHHLRSEWQKALEEFISLVGTQVTVIALTATPPYDSTPAQWKRYLAICGETDDEIYVPQLVAQKTLCPHQDYICFSYPTEEESAEITKLLAKNGEDAPEKIDKILCSSAGKLESIKKIVEAEQENFGNDLRMLILTDYIKKDAVKELGTEKEVTEIGAVPVFEAIRRVVMPPLKVAMLSGSLVIVPNSVAGAITTVAGRMNCPCTVRPIENTAHSEMIFSGSNKNKVAVMTEALGEGLINVLVGTKALLGEGWDSPCINSLILASFVGSFMLSNQMRGRAIRTDRNVPDKAADIWHLATLPPASSGLGPGGDYEMLKRRFGGFLAPAYGSGVIENGTDRLDILPADTEPFDIDEVNEKMFALAADRKGMAARWTESLKGKEKPEVVDVSIIPEAFVPKVSTGLNKFIVALAAAAVLLLLLVPASALVLKAVKMIGIAAAVIAAAVNLIKIISVAKPEKRIKGVASAILESVNACGAIDSSGAKIIVEKKDGIRVMLTNTGVHEKNVFSKAVAEFFAPIEDQRYLLLRNRGGINTRGGLICYGCPSVFANKKENVEAFRERVKKYTDPLEIVYTRSESGKRTAEKCAANSLFNNSAERVISKKTVL